MRFLLRWQHVTPGDHFHGVAGVLAAVEQLQGFEAAVSSWEPLLLAARVRDYRSEWLDALAWSGDVVWGRLSPKPPDPDSLHVPATLSRATPVTLATRADFSWLLAAARGGAAPAEPFEGNAARVLTALRTRGALFASELGSELGLSAPEIDAALWDSVARGLVASDGFQPARALVLGRAPGASGFTARRSSLRRGARDRRSSEGRWALLPSVSVPEEREALAEAVAEQLLARWGVVLRELAQRETLAIPYRDVMWALRRLEARGRVRGGRFVAGFVGEQYALPEAVDLLRSVRRADHGGQRIQLSACDPLNLVGVIVPGARVAALRTNSVTYVDGAPIALPAVENAVGSSSV
jgi:ATP-dependent Lhr-like helicase